MQGLGATLGAAWRFAVHVIVGTLLFVLVAMVALGLAKFVEWLAAVGMPSPILETITVLEYAVFIADVTGYVTFLINAVIHLVRDLWHT